MAKIDKNLSSFEECSFHVPWSIGVSKRSQVEKRMKIERYYHQIIHKCILNEIIHDSQDHDFFHSVSLIQLSKNKNTSDIHPNHKSADHFSTVSLYLLFVHLVELLIFYLIFINYLV